MSTRTTPAPTDALWFALWGPSRENASQDLSAGLEHEHARLGHRPYLVAMWRTEFDIDGQTDYLTLLESYDTRDQAIRASEQASADLLAAHTSPTGPHTTLGKIPWVHLPSREPHPLIRLQPLGAEGVTTHHEQSFSLKGGYCESMYCTFYVLGPFPGAVVGHELVSVFDEKRDELAEHFKRVGARRRRL